MHACNMKPQISEPCWLWATIARNGKFQDIIVCIPGCILIVRLPRNEYTLYFVMINSVVDNTRELLFRTIAVNTNVQS
jgi:hypothetical protein